MKVHDFDCLVVAPHPDDAELGMGGSIKKMIEAGWKVGIVDLTSGEPTPYGSIEKRQRETAAASLALGVSWRRNLDLPNRSLVDNLDSRRIVAEVFRETRPRWLFAPYWVDAHPDHIAATGLVEGARFWAKLTKTDMSGEPWHPQRIFYYYCVHLKMHPVPAWVMDVSSQWTSKMDALACYHSQFVEGREQVQPPFLERIENEGKWWGQSIGVRYGEPFASREPVGLSDFSSLI